MISHSKLLKCIKIFKLPVDDGGICYGFSGMAMQALLAEDMKTFWDRFRVLAAIDENQLYARYLQAKEAEKKQQRLQKEHYSLLSLPAFFEGAVQYFSPGKHPILSLQTSIPLQDIEHTFPFLLPTALVSRIDALHLRKEIKDPEDVKNSYVLTEEKLVYVDEKGSEKEIKMSAQDLATLHALTHGDDPFAPKTLKISDFKVTQVEEINQILKANGADPIFEETPLIKKVKDFSGLYDCSEDKEELEDYFKLLQIHLQKVPLTTPVAFVLLSSEHAITVGWDPKEGKWIFVDSNNLTDRLMGPQEIARRVQCAFSTSAITTFKTEIYARKDQAALVGTALEACAAEPTWQAIHQVTLEKTKMTDSNGASWLRLAARLNCLEEAIALLQLQHIDVNQADYDGVTALHKAICQRSSTIVAELLKHKEIQINLAANDGLAALHKAVESGQADIVAQLLKREDINVNQAMPCGATALYIAAQDGFSDIVAQLLAHPGIHTKGMDADASVLIDKAGEKHRISYLRALFNEKKLTLKKGTLSGFTPLHAAAFFGHTEIVLQLLQSGKVMPTEMAQGGITALDFAKAMNNTAVVEILEKLTPYNDIYALCTDLKKAIAGHGRGNNPKEKTAVLQLEKTIQDTLIYCTKPKDKTISQEDVEETKQTIINATREAMDETRPQGCAGWFKRSSLASRLEKVLAKYPVEYETLSMAAGF